MNRLLVFVICILCTACAPKTYNDDDVIGEIVINSNGKACLNYELCSK